MPVQHRPHRLGIAGELLGDVGPHHQSHPALGWTSADAAGLPILPGLLKYEEVAADRLHHALRFTIPQVRRAYTAPASHCGQYADDALPPYGTRVRLRASFPLDDYSGDALVILKAMKRYGLILADQGSVWYLTGRRIPGRRIRWNSCGSSGCEEATSRCSRQGPSPPAELRRAAASRSPAR